MIYLRKVLKLAQELNEKLTNIQNPRYKKNTVLENEPELMDTFNRELSALIQEIGGELLTLKYQSFNPKVWKIFTEIRKELIAISHFSIQNPYISSIERFIKFVFEKPNKSFIDNLEFFLDHHSQSSTGNPIQINGARKLKELAYQWHMRLERMNGEGVRPSTIKSPDTLRDEEPSTQRKPVEEELEGVFPDDFDKKTQKSLPSNFQDPYANQADPYSGLNKEEITKVMKK